MSLIPDLHSKLSSSLHGDTLHHPKFGIIPSQLPDLKLWCRYGQGITTATGVSQWDDVSGNGNHLKQATGANQPALQSDGSILFNGVAHHLKADAFTLVQPETIYLLFKQVTWTAVDRIFDGNTVNSGVVYQEGTTPNIATYAGAAGAKTTDLAVDTYGVMAVMFDHDNSLNIIQINNNTPSTDVAFGTADMGGFILGSSATPNNWSNIQVKEVLVYGAAHNAEQRAQVIRYLQSI